MKLLRITFILMIFVGVIADGPAQIPLSLTRKDWAPLSDSIAAADTTAYDKFHSIYRWICQNIAYDYKFKVNTADKCIEQRIGTCNAYCEVFCRLAQAQGLVAVSVGGLGKTTEHIEEHAWVYALLDPKEGRGIMIDPAWGAAASHNIIADGYNGDDNWFDVDPGWMIFTHFPDEDKFMFLQRPVSYDDFIALPRHTPWMRDFGIDSRYLLDCCLDSIDPQLPTYYSILSECDIHSVTAPTNRHLNVGQPLEVMLKTGLSPADMAFIGDGRGPGYNIGQWKRDGEYLIGRIMPARSGDLKLAVRQPQDKYMTLIDYQVAEPTMHDIEVLESSNPELSPEWDKFEYHVTKQLSQLGIDFGEALTEVKCNNLSKFPIFYSGVDFRIKDIPLNGELKQGQTYTFEFFPVDAEECAIIMNCGGPAQWLKDWTTDLATGAQCITVTPPEPGKLKVTVRKAGSDKFASCFQYDIVP